MADPRASRCISAAFDFLQAEFCDDCIHGYQTGSDDASLHLSSGRKVKKSESDTALLTCLQENRENLQKVKKVCLCEQRHRKGGAGNKADKSVCGCALNGDNCPQPAGNQTITDCGHSVGKLTDTDIKVSQANGSVIAESCDNHRKATDFSGSDLHVCQRACASGDKAPAAVSSSTDCTPSSASSSEEGPTGVSNCDQSGQIPPGDHTAGEENMNGKSANEQAGEEGESCEEEVVMRPNRPSQPRRPTNTAVISSAFDFLPSTDSVFLPSLAAADNAGRCSPVAEESPSCPQEVCGDGDRGKAEGGQSTGEEGEGGQSSLDPAGKPSTAGEEDKETEVRLRRSRLSKQESTEDDGSGDSSDEDAGVYAESFRRSNWVRIDDDGQLELAFPAVDVSRLSSASKSSTASRSSTDTTDCSKTPSPRVSSDDPPQFPDKCPSPKVSIFHRRSDSTSTTLSEREFKREYAHKRKCLIQRQQSSQEYHRYSAKAYDEERSLVLQKALDETDFGLHILDSEPAYITRVDPGTAAARAGVEEGQILVSVNGVNALTLSHSDIVALISNSSVTVRLDVATSEFQPSRDLQAAVVEGFMHKLGGPSPLFPRRWKRRFFVLRQDSCLYYYKQRDESDPLGAIPLAGYTFSRHLDSGRDFCFKAEKYGARTYYFMTDGRDDLTEWVGALSDAAAKSKKRKDSFVSVSSHNVGLPALEVRRPECRGYLLKVGHRYKTWRRRYCILKDACLYYYKNINSLSALGVAHLHGYKVDPAITVGKKHAFGLIPPDDSLRTFQFSAENDTDRQRWVEAMIHSIQRWVQIDHSKPLT